MSTIRWLHISDLHINKTGTETERLRESLPKYLKKLNTPCDYVFCTGDIRYAPDGQFPNESGEFLKQICDSVQVPLSNFFVVPGNHDVNRNIQGRDSAIKRLFYFKHNQQSGYYTPEEGKINSKELGPIMSGLKDYEKVLKEILTEQTQAYKNNIQTFGAHKLIKTELINILLIDTTLAYMKGQERDLIIGTYNLRCALEKIDRQKPTIALTHYSFDFLERKEQAIVCGLLMDYNVRIWLSGHEHDHLCRKQRDFFYEFQTGNLVLENGAKSCIIMGELDTETLLGKIEVHAWFSPEGWALYPFASSRSGAVYYFNLKDNESNKPINIDKQRKELRSEIIPLLLENQSIFEFYGPTEKNRQNLWSERESIWEKMIQENILPNSLRVIELLESNKEILYPDEMRIFQEYKMHIQGFSSNHKDSHCFVVDAPTFPQEIFTIL